MLSADYTDSVRCNCPATDWRQRVAQWLRSAATRLDGRWTLAIEMRSDPPVPLPRQAEVLRKGVEHMGRLFHHEAGFECGEHLLRRALPRLFEAPGGCANRPNDPATPQ